MGVRAGPPAVRATGTDDETVALSGEMAGSGFTDSAAGTGDENDFGGGFTGHVFQEFNGGLIPCRTETRWQIRGFSEIPEAPE